MTIIQLQSTKNLSIKARRRQRHACSPSVIAKALLVFFISFILVLHLDEFYNELSVKHKNGRNRSIRRAERPLECTQEQRSKVLQQLVPDKCSWDTSKPWYQKCSFTQATKEPDSTWLKSHYETVHTMSGNNGIDNVKFLAVFVGCNSGYEAVDALRMGTGDAKYNKNAWAGEIKDMRSRHNNRPVSDRNEFQLSVSNSNSSSDATVYCIDHITTSTAKFKSATSNLGWSSNFHVIDGIVSKDVGAQYFMRSAEEVNGKHDSYDDEKCLSMKEEDPEAFENFCVTVQSAPLNTYLKETQKAQNDDIRIQLLRINAQGYDFDVLMGAKETLSATEYLEFEYNWMGSWQNHNLFDAVKMLDDLGFTCYFAGSGYAWRIDESCWLDHYDWHSWASVACANRQLNKNVADNLEETFIKTLEKELTY